MPFSRVLPDDHDAVATAVHLLNEAQVVDDHTSPARIHQMYERNLRYGWDLRPEEVFLYVPDGEVQPVGLFSIDMPVRDNRHLVWTELTVAPTRRREGHGSAMLAEVLRRAREAGRTIVWAGGAKDAPSTAGFLEHHGFRYASHDARRKQRLADVDPAEIDRLHHEASVAAADYELIRLVPPHPEDLMREIAEVAEAINDAPMGELTYEREVFDLQLMLDLEAARVGRGERQYRVVARDRVSGRLAGHTMVVVHPLRPTFGGQGDTAVARQHRGHRLGLLLKTEMMRWLAEVEPQLEVIETFNQADNGYMIKVNEALGYRLDRVFAMYELQLDPDQTAAQQEPALAQV